MATTVDDLDRLCSRLVGLGVTVEAIAEPATHRRLVLGSHSDEWAAERVAATLRADGEIALVRPDRGGRLEGWTQHTRPAVFGRRLSVCFAWSEHDRRELPDAIELGLGGFGNGEHPTTRLLVEELIAHVHGGERVLDVGCGSGVLGLCALRLGAAHVTAVDIKPEAIEAARRNAALNGVGACLEATTATLGEIEGPFDIVVANVARAALVELAPHLVRLVAPGGWLAASGISSAQCELVAGFLAPLVEADRRASGEWSALVLTA